MTNKFIFYQISPNFETDKKIQYWLSTYKSTSNIKFFYVEHEEKSYELYIYIYIYIYIYFSYTS